MALMDIFFFTKKGRNDIIDGNCLWPSKNWVQYPQKDIENNKYINVVYIIVSILLCSMQKPNVTTDYLNRHLSLLIKLHLQCISACIPRHCTV